MIVLTNLVLREKLTNDDLSKCLQALEVVDTMEQNGEALPVPNTFQYTTKIVTAKAKRSVKHTLSLSHWQRTVDCREEAYRFLWREIEYFVRGYKETSDNHRQIYQSITNRRKIDTDNDSSLYLGYVFVLHSLIGDQSSPLEIKLSSFSPRTKRRPPPFR